jgi:hypothetical protein
MQTKHLNPHATAIRLLIAAAIAKIHRTIGPPMALIGNIAEGVHNGNITKKSDAAITTRYIFGKKGSDDDHIAACTTDTDNPYGVITDEATAAEEIVNVALLGAAQETRRITLGGTVAVGDFLQCDAVGKGKKLSTASGTYYIVGRALMAGVAGDVIEFDPIPSVQRIVP